jgi:hypothetical protein
MRLQPFRPVLLGLAARGVSFNVLKNLNVAFYPEGTNAAFDCVGYHRSLPFPAKRLLRDAKAVIAKRPAFSLSFFHDNLVGPIWHCVSREAVARTLHTLSQLLREMGTKAIRMKAIAGLTRK